MYKIVYYFKILYKIKENGGRIWALDLGVKPFHQVNTSYFEPKKLGPLHSLLPKSSNIIVTSSLQAKLMPCYLFWAVHNAEINFMPSSSHLTNKRIGWPLPIVQMVFLYGIMNAFFLSKTPRLYKYVYPQVEQSTCQPYFSMPLCKHPYCKPYKS